MKGILFSLALCLPAICSAETYAIADTGRGWIYSMYLESNGPCTSEPGWRDAIRHGMPLMCWRYEKEAECVVGADKKRICESGVRFCLTTATAIRHSECHVVGSDYLHFPEKRPFE